MTNTISITCKPLRPSKASSRPRYATHLNGQHLCDSATPFFSSARALMREGADPEAILVMRHEGSEVVALTGKLHLAAKLTVTEDDTRGLRVTRYRDPALRMPEKVGGGRPRMAETAPGASTMPAAAC